MSYKDYITEVNNFPIDGVSFKDISPLLANEEVFKSTIRDMGSRVRIPDYWVGIDARGFIFASALSIYYGGGVVMCRKEGKLPPPTSINSVYTCSFEPVIVPSLCVILAGIILVLH